MNEKFANKRFLNEFFLQLVSAYARRKAEKVEETKKAREKPKEKGREEKLERLPFIRPFVMPQPILEKPELLPPKPPVLPQMPLIPLKKREVGIAEIIETGKLDLNKIEQIMADPAVVSIECNGPNEKIRIRKDDSIITAESLTKEEIKNIIESISKRTKVPISTIFRAIFNGITINAIISDIIGMRFIITKETEKEKEAE